MYVSECVASPVTSLQRGGRWEEGGASVPVAVRRQAMLRYEHGLLADVAEAADRRSVGAARVWDRRAVDMQQREVALRRHGILLKKVSTFFHFDFLRALECIFVEVPSEVRWVFEPIFVGFLRSTSAMRNVPGFQKR